MRLACQAPSPRREPGSASRGGARPCSATRRAAPPALPGPGAAAARRAPTARPLAAAALAGRGLSGRGWCHMRGDLADEPGDDLVLRADLDGAHRDLRPPRERAGVALLLGQDDRDDVSPAARPGRAAGAV